MADVDAREEIRAAFDDVVDAQNSGDAARLRLALSGRADAVHIGTDPGEWWTSADLVTAMGNLGDDGVRVVTDDLGVHVAGDVGWVEGRGRFTHPGGAERPARFTAVLTREDGRWRVVQSHASIGFPNEEMFG